MKQLATSPFRRELASSPASASPRALAVRPPAAVMHTRNLAELQRAEADSVTLRRQVNALEQRTRSRR